MSYATVPDFPSAYPNQDTARLEPAEAMGVPSPS
jgi:hypothetical protein